LDKENLIKILNASPPVKDKKWDKDWFNFLKVNTEQKDTTASQNAYISLRFVLKILMNYMLVSGNVDESFFTFNLPIYNKKAGETGLEKDGDKFKEYNVLPVTSNQFIMSSSDEVIFPTNELPIISAPKPAGKNEPALSDEENVVKIGNGTVDGTINGYNFHTTEVCVGMGRLQRTPRLQLQMLAVRHGCSTPVRLRSCVVCRLVANRQKKYLSMSLLEEVVS